MREENDLIFRRNWLRILIRIILCSLRAALIPSKLILSYCYMTHACFARQQEVKTDFFIHILFPHRWPSRFGFRNHHRHHCDCHPDVLRRINAQFTAQGFLLQLQILSRVAAKPLGDGRERKAGKCILEFLCQINLLMDDS